MATQDLAGTAWPAGSSQVSSRSATDATPMSVMHRVISSRKMSQPDMKTPPDDPPALLARRLVRGLDRAVLATSLDGWPYASLVMIATAPEGEPLLLISDLAQHTMNIVPHG